MVALPAVEAEREYALRKVLPINGLFLLKLKENNGFLQYKIVQAKSCPRQSRIRRFFFARLELIQGAQHRRKYNWLELPLVNRLVVRFREFREQTQ
jgi:hypothetical protein